MPDSKIERFLWMVEVLGVTPSQRLLEIGCGSGISVQHIAPTLTTGKITAVDRSQAMLAKAITRNRAFINNGKVEFIQTDLSTLPNGDGKCNKIFAFNVNLFWTKKDISEEMSVINSHIKRDGHLYLFYQPPDKDQCSAITGTVAINLKSHGYLVTSILYEEGIRSCCVISRPQ